ncbi:methyltransferase domain-containing protein [Glycomyces xiaoerkulensis]|uniref:methyltransferase domain-containing protein n=1 Tax=Glycomyces xiaoerkulensis TaxID=2038139 RepID=UPI000C26301A|nr:methyltransferase domain-containing protein [Glycomyces xiaoerkulensis]
MAQTHTELPVDPAALRASVREKYRDVALHPDGRFHFHNGRPLAALLGYDRAQVDSLPDRAVESFAGVANPFGFHPIGQNDRLVDIGSGGGFDSFVATQLVGPEGRVVGVDMTPEMLAKSRRTAEELELRNVEFREGIAENLPIEDGWADVVVSNGVLNLVADKAAVFTEIFRVLRGGGRLQFADIAVNETVPADAACNIDLWTDCIAGGQSKEGWRSVIEGAGFVDVEIGPAVDVFAGAGGEENARRFNVLAHVFYARKPE